MAKNTVLGFTRFSDLLQVLIQTIKELVTARISKLFPTCKTTDEANAASIFLLLLGTANAFQPNILAYKSILLTLNKTDTIFSAGLGDPERRADLFFKHI